MKKLLGVSIVAMLAISPMMASAAEGDRTVTKIEAASVSKDTNIATTSYVKGAYKATADKIDALIDDTAIAANGNYIDAEKTVAHNLKELDTAIKNVADTAGNTYQLVANSTVDADGNYIEEGTGVASNLSALDTAIGKNTSDGTYIKDSDEKNVSENLVLLDTAVAGLAGSKQDASDSTVATGTYNHITQGTGVATNLVNLDSAVGKVAADGTYIKDYEEKNVSENLVLLDTAVAGLASSKQDASKSTVASGTYNTISAGDGVAANLVALDTAVGNLGTDSATKTGVVATINHSTTAGSGTITVYDDFNTPSSSASVTVNTTGTVSAPGTNHNQYYPTYDGTAAAQANGVHVEP